MTDHEIYARNLLSDKGFAPYYPGPVNIAEVGYVFGGNWEPLFNASKKPGEGNDELGVPNGYRPLDVGKLNKKILSSGPITNERGTSIGFGIQGSSAAIAVASADAQYTFTSSKQEGAILVPGGTIDTADALERSRYVRYIRENYASWLEFANERHHRDLRSIDLVLVTGWHKTASWACAAFSQCSREITLTFNVGAGIAQAGVWGKWSDIVSPGVWRHSGPSRASLKDEQLSLPQTDKSPMNVDNLENVTLPARSEQMEGAYQSCSADVQALGNDPTNIRDQGIFIRGYKICDRHTGLARIMYRKHVKDGFTVIHPHDHEEVIRGRSIDDNHHRGGEDTDRDGDPSSSRRDPPSGGPGNSSSAPWSSSSVSQGGEMGRSSNRNSGPSSSSPKDDVVYSFSVPWSSSFGSQGGKMSRSSNGNFDSSSSSHKDSFAFNFSVPWSSSSGSQGGEMSRSSDGNSGPSSSSHKDDLAYDFKLDDDLALYLQLNGDKEPTAVEIILEYILENSTAEFSLAHDDDVTELLRDGCSAEDFAVEIRKISPRILLIDQDPLPEYSQTDQLTQSTGRSSQFLAPTTLSAFEPSESSLPSSWPPSPSLLSPISPISLPEVTGAASEREIATDTKGDDVDRTFNDRQRAYFEDLIQEKWECPQEGHGACVPTEDKQHFRLSDHNIQYWVNALCKGTATTAEPPQSVFEDIGGGLVWNRDNGNSIVYAVSVAPSRRKPGPHYNPVGNRARSVDSSVDSSVNVRSGSLISSHGGSSYTRTTSVTSRVRGPGYFGSKAIKWLGEKGLGMIQHNVIVTRAESHLATLEQWKRHQVMLGVAEQDKVFEMLGDALEISQSCYSRSENHYGYLIGRAVHHWLHAYQGIPKSKELLFWFIQVQISLVPIFLFHISRVDPFAGDLAHRILVVVMKVPLAVQSEEMSATVVSLIVHGLAYTKCSSQHWLGIWLLRIVEMSLRVRNLSHIEVTAIKELAIRREEQNTNYNAEQEEVLRPWEVALFARCASQDTWFQDAVTGTKGLLRLVADLDAMLAQDMPLRDFHWRNVALTSQALAFLSEQEWVVHAIDPTIIIKSLLQVFRQNIPERWFCIRFWVADTMHNMVAHRPKLSLILLQENAVSVFETVSNPQLDHQVSIDLPRLEIRRHKDRSVPSVSSVPSLTFASHSSASSIGSSLQFSPQYLSGRVALKHFLEHEHERHFSESPRHGISFPRSGTPSNEDAPMPSRWNSRGRPSLSPPLGQEWLVEDYKMQTTKCTKELSDYIRKWPTEMSRQRLQVLGADIGWLSGWEGEWAV